MCLFTATGLAVGGIADAEVFKPANENQVLEHSRATPGDPATREMREWRRALATDPTNLPLAIKLTRLCVERSRAEADPRYLGYAQSALGPWWESPNPPLEALVLRATIRQSNHEFVSALADLDLATRLDPQNAQAWLTKVTVLQVTGQIEAARRACLPLTRLAPELVAATALSQVASLGGNAKGAYETLRVSLARNRGADSSIKGWALTALAEIAIRLEHNNEATKFFREAMGLGTRDPYLLAAYADFLLDEKRPDEVIELLDNESRADALLLRLALAKTALPEATKAGHRSAAQLTEMLNDRFAAARLRGSSVHRREEAIFRLKLRHDAAKALSLAAANWGVQREPADARILLESALAARDPAVARPALDWLAANHVEDARLEPLVRELASMMATAATKAR
ncbi:MAG TPA: hypothetical protein VHH73_00355 [Verrucomicrobiae bacterium]|nr:hypothetical protein [Verrucomicrobiae bacterium]